MRGNWHPWAGWDGLLPEGRRECEQGGRVGPRAAWLGWRLRGVQRELVLEGTVRADHRDARSLQPTGSQPARVACFADGALWISVD